MLDSTFIHADGIGGTTERRLWERGLTTWKDVLCAESLPLTAAQRRSLLPTVETSVERLAAGDHGWFARALPQREHWRAAPVMMDHVGFLDIETDGGYGPDNITIIGVYDGDQSRIYVKGEDLQQFAEDADRYRMFITFFGTGFDLPMLRRRFPGLPLDQLHVDLCPALRRLGFRGGLKSIERQLGIARDDSVAGLSGFDAVRLWHAWANRDDRSALDRLVEYNRADVENLSLLLAFAYGRLRDASGFPVQRSH